MQGLFQIQQKTKNPNNETQVFFKDSFKRISTVAESGFESVPLRGKKVLEIFFEFFHMTQSL